MLHIFKLYDVNVMNFLDFSCTESQPCRLLCLINLECIVSCSWTFSEWFIFCLLLKYKVETSQLVLL